MKIYPLLSQVPFGQQLYYLQVLQDLLLSTNSTHIYEHTKNDCYWADCEDRTGKNRLGEELMQVREELRNSTKVDSNTQELSL